MGVMETTCALCGEWFYPMSPGKLCGGDICYTLNIQQKQTKIWKIIEWLMKL